MPTPPQIIAAELDRLATERGLTVLLAVGGGENDAIKRPTPRRSPPRPPGCGGGGTGAGGGATGVLCGRMNLGVFLAPISAFTPTTVPSIHPHSPMLDLHYLDNVNTRDLGNLELLAKQVVEGFIIGLHKSPFHGFSVEFAEHRIYNPGESTKNIDWKVYARTDKLFTKRYEEETNLRCQIVVDASSSMYFPEVTKKSEAAVNKLRFSALAAAALMNLLKKQRDAFGLSTFDEAVRIHTPARSSTAHYRLLLTYLTDLINHEEHHRTTNAAQALHQIADSVHKRSLVVIFSDMFDDPARAEELFNALQHLKHAKHEVILFHTVDKKLEEEFAFENRPYLFVDLETGEQVRLQSNQVKEHYVAQMADFKQQLREKCLQYRIDLVETDINAGFRPILQQYLVKRARMSR